jgi:glycosyltransferase involved in cell wall biosynthesis
VLIFPACNSDKIWEYLCAADIFAFASHNEGMPNSLLEAMGMGVPAIAFAIPAVLELEAGMGAPLLIPTFDSVLFAQAILRLAARPEDRACVGEKGRDRVMNRFMVKTNMGLALSRLAAVVQQRSASVLGSDSEPAPVRKQLQ